MNKWKFLTISNATQDEFDEALNRAGQDGWDIAKFSTIYDPEKGPLFIAVMRAPFQVEEAVANVEQRRPSKMEHPADQPQTK